MNGTMRSKSATSTKTSKLAAIAVVLNLIVPPVAISPARAHDTAHSLLGHLAHEFLEGNETAIELERFLHERRERFLRSGTNLPPLEERLAGERLAKAAMAEWREFLKTQGPNSFSEKAVGEFKHRVLARINPVALGRWLWETTQKRGASIAVIFGVSEMIEQFSVLYATTTLRHMYLIPLSVFHVWDALTAVLVFGAPNGIKTVRRWVRLGGVRATYTHWVRQRQLLPLDWNHVLGIEEFRSGAASHVQFAVSRDPGIQSRLPRALRILLDPRRLAADEAAVTVNLAELEKIAADAGIHLKSLQPLGRNTELYAMGLTREIHASDTAHRALAALLGKKGLLDKPELLHGVGADDLLALIRGERAATTPTDLLAQRFAWYTRFRLDAIETLAEDGSKELRREVYRRLRALRKRLENGRGLVWMAESHPEAMSRADVIREARSLLAEISRIEQQYPGLRPAFGVPCDRLLLF